MVGNTCDVCGQPSIGVASSSLGPVSWAFCGVCMSSGAEPEILMWYLRDIVGEVHPSLMWQLTFVDGKYISYKDWLALNKPPLPEPSDDDMLPIDDASFEEFP